MAKDPYLWMSVKETPDVLKADVGETVYHFFNQACSMEFLAIHPVRETDAD